MQFPPAPPEQTPAPGAFNYPMPVWFVMLERMGLPTALVCILLWWGYCAATFLSPLAVRQVEATELVAKQSVETSRILNTITDTQTKSREATRTEHDGLMVVVRDARDEARAVRLVLERAGTIRR
jgi:hypothetical protein